MIIQLSPVIAAYIPLPGSPEKPSTPSIIKGLASNKPLPSPPMVPNMTHDLMEASRSLIDASEKCLRRSPPDRTDGEEDWPSLFPERPTTPFTLRQMTHPTAALPSHLTTGEKKRYSLMTAHRAEEPMIGDARSAETKYSTSKHSIARKPLTPPKDYPPSKLASQPSCSVGTAAVDNYEAEAKSFPEPRQTRTSTLRARLSAGSVISNESGASAKGVGFTDFTKDPSNNITTRSARSRRAPAKIIAGSRRPTSRQDSRQSLRGDFRALNSAGDIEKECKNMAFDVDKNENNVLEIKPADVMKIDDQVTPRKSSIPVMNKSLPGLAVKDISSHRSKSTKVRSALLDLPSAETPGKVFSIFDDGLPTVPGSTQYSQLPVAANTSANTFSRAEIYRVKRLSENLAGHGPTLKISASAEHIIMGKETDKENTPKTGVKQDDDLRRAVMMESHTRKLVRIATKMSAGGRPSSSDDTPQSNARRGDLKNKERSMKARSDDLDGAQRKEKLRHSDSVKSVTSLEATKSSVNDEDPFYAAHFTNVDRERVRSSPKAGENLGLYNKAASNKEGRSWNSAVPKQDIGSVDNGIEIGLQIGSGPNEAPGKPSSEATRGSGNCGNFETALKKPTQGIQQSKEMNAKKAAREGQPHTPERAIQSTSGSGSSSFPLRNSSRTVHPDFTTGSGMKDPSPATLLGRAAHNPSQEFGIHQNELDGSTDLGSSQVNLQPSKTDATATTKRDSTAQSSYKSQSSFSKSTFSSRFRGIFHKRSSESTGQTSLNTSIRPTEKKEEKKPSKSTIKVSMTGSPFPATSEAQTNRRTRQPIPKQQNNQPSTQQTPLTQESYPHLSSPNIPSPAQLQLSSPTALAMSILESARHESSSPKKEKLLELGKAMVDAITQARDAEKAMEEARLAAGRAEGAYELCKGAVGGVCRAVEGLRERI